MGRSSTINIGRKLKLPATQESIELFTQKRVEYHMSMEEDFYNQYQVSELKQKTIKRGETLWDISHDSDGAIPLWLLKKYNKHTDLSNLFPGTNIWLPIISAASENESTALDLWRGLLPAYYAPNTIEYRPEIPLP